MRLQSTHYGFCSIAYANGLHTNLVPFREWVRPFFPYTKRREELQRLPRWSAQIKGPTTKSPLLLTTCLCTTGELAGLQTGRWATTRLSIYRPTQNSELLLRGMFFYSAKYTELEQKNRTFSKITKRNVLKLTTTSVSNYCIFIQVFLLVCTQVSADDTQNLIPRSFRPTFEEINLSRSTHTCMCVCVSCVCVCLQSLCRFFISLYDENELFSPKMLWRV